MAGLISRRVLLLVCLSGLVGTPLIYVYMTCSEFSSKGSTCVVGKLYERVSLKAIPSSCSEEKSRKYLSQMVIGQLYVYCVYCLLALFDLYSAWSITVVS